MAVLSVAEAKRHLGLTDPAVDPAVEAVVAAAEAAIARRCGDLEPTPRTELVTADGGPLIVRGPVVSFTSVSKDGSAVTIDPATAPMLDIGVIPGSFRGDFTVTYTSGRTTVPPDLLMGIKELVAHLWNTTQRSAAERRGRNAEQPGPTGMSYLLPYRVEQWIAPYSRASVG